jgi:hypothetical protein
MEAHRERLAHLPGTRISDDVAWRPGSGTDLCCAEWVAVLRIRPPHLLLWAHKLAQADGGELRLVVPAGGAVARIITSAVWTI